MIPHDDQPRARGSAAQQQYPFASTRRRTRSRCNDSSGDWRPVPYELCEGRSFNSVSSNGNLDFWHQRWCHFVRIWTCASTGAEFSRIRACASTGAGPPRCICSWIFYSFVFFNVFSIRCIQFNHLEVCRLRQEPDYLSVEGFAESHRGRRHRRVRGGRRSQTTAHALLGRNPAPAPPAS